MAASCPVIPKPRNTNIRAPISLPGASAGAAVSSSTDCVARSSHAEVGRIYLPAQEVDFFISGRGFGRNTRACVRVCGCRQRFLADEVTLGQLPANELRHRRSGYAAA